MLRVEPCQRDIATDEIQDKNYNREHPAIISRAYQCTDWLIAMQNGKLVITFCQCIL